MSSRYRNEPPSGGVIVPSQEFDPVDTSRPRGHILMIALTMLVAAATWTTIGRSEPSGNGGDSLDAPESSVEVQEGQWIEQEFPGRGGFTASAAGPRGLVSVATGRRIDSYPLVFFSNDFQEWSEAAFPAVAGDLVAAVTWNGVEFVAVGSRHGPDLSAPTVSAPALWASTDGTRWSERATIGLPDIGMIHGLTFDGTNLTAIGWDGPGVFEPTLPPPPGAEGKVWSSQDGRAWIDITPAGEHLWFTDAIVVGTDVVISGSIDGQPTAWSSTQRTVWNVSVNDESPAGEVAVSLTSTDDGLIAIVRSIADLESLVTVWRVDFQLGWSRLDRRSPPDSAGWVRWVDGMLYAGVGFTRTAFPDGPELWTSESGVNWTGVEVTSGPSPWPPTIIASVSKLSDRMIAFGSRGGKPTAWSLIDR